MKKILKTLFIILSIIIGCYILFIGVMWWNSPDPRERQSFIIDQHKLIVFENKCDSVRFFIKINFKYDQEDSLILSNAKMTNSTNSFSKLDSMVLSCFPNNKELLTLPILNSDSIMFPKTFYVKIYNEDKSKLLKELDFNSFIQHAILKYVANENNPLTADQWTLVIDSTLLYLKK